VLTTRRGPPDLRGAGLVFVARLVYLQGTVCIYRFREHYGTVSASSKRTRSPGAGVVACPSRRRGDYRRGAKLRQPGQTVFVNGVSGASGDATEICRCPRCHRRSWRAVSGKHLSDPAAAALGRPRHLMTSGFLNHKVDGTVMKASRRGRKASRLPVGRGKADNQQVRRHSRPRCENESL
jgi:hypothetical protein